MTSRLIYVCVVIFCCCLGANNSMVIDRSTRDDSLNDYIKQILEKLKEKIPTGIPEIGVPPLDPFDVPKFDIPHISESVVEIDVAINDLVVTGLANFETSKVESDLNSLQIELGLHVPRLRGDADYDLDGTIIGFIPLTGNGPMYISLKGVDVTGVVDLKLNADQYLQVEKLRLGADFYSGSLHFDNLVGGGNFGELVNAALNILVPFIWDKVESPVFSGVEKALTSLLNDLLGKCSLEEIMSNNCQML